MKAAKRPRPEIADPIEPTAESRQHGEIEALTPTPEGRAHRRIELVERLLRDGKIINSQYNAAVAYRDTFDRAHAGEIRAVDLMASGGGSTGLAWTESRERAKRALWRWDAMLEPLSPGLTGRFVATVCENGGLRDWGSTLRVKDRNAAITVGLAELRIALNVLAAAMGY